MATYPITSEIYAIGSSPAWNILDATNATRKIGSHPGLLVVKAVQPSVEVPLTGQIWPLGIN